MQQDLLAPRISPIAGAELAGSLLPAYNVGGDWFDHAENPEGAWLTVADAMGKGMRATAVSTIALAALRGARRYGDSLEECGQAVDDAVLEMAVVEPTFVTAVIATWHAASRRPPLERAQRNLAAGDRVIFYSDGITERRTPSGLSGIDGLIGAARAAADPSAAAVTDAIEQAVMSASEDDLSDDATQLVLRVD